MSEMLFLF